MDYRVQPLVMLVKRWAKTHNINDASLGTLSSYALALMVIHYLQGMFDNVTNLKFSYCKFYFFLLLSEGLWVKAGSPDMHMCT